MKNFTITFLVCLLVSITSYGQTQSAHTFTADDLFYIEYFTGLEADGTTFLTGWKGTDNYDGSDIPNLVPTDGSGLNLGGNVYNVGKRTDRAMGTTASGTLVPIFGAKFTNNTGSKIIQLEFMGVCEQWRTGDNNTVHERNKFAYSFNTTNLKDGDWIEVSAFDLFEIQTGSTTAGALDGNKPENRRDINATVTIAWENGTDMWIRWVDNDDTGKDALLAIDDLEITATMEPIPSISINTPNPTSYWIAGKTYNITWDYENIPDNTPVNIHFSPNASTTPPDNWQQIASNIPISNRAYSWATSTAQYANEDCKIRITAATTPNPTVQISETFNIVGRFPNLYRLRNGSPGNYDPGVIGRTYMITGGPDPNLPYDAVITHKYGTGYYDQEYMYMQDGTAGILIHDQNGKLTNAYNVGDGLRYFIGTYVNDNGMYKLVPVSFDEPISYGNTTIPQVVTIPELNSANFINHQAELMKLESVRFVNSTGTFAEGQVYTIIDQNNNEFDFRTSFSNADYIGGTIPPILMDMIVLPNTTVEGNFVTCRGYQDFIPFIVTSPKWGDYWEQGTTYNITWMTPSFVTGNVTIEYTTDANAQPEPTWETLATVPVTNGTWEWQIPSTQTVGDNYKIRLTATSGQVSYSGIFSIVPPIPSITVNTPKSGTNWKQGTNMTITWTSENITGNVDIFYKPDITTQTGNWSQIASDVDVAAGTYTWNIDPSQQLGTKYGIAVVAMSTVPGQDAVVDTSGIFNITDSEILPKVFITEYLEGSESVQNLNKAIEIYNGTGGDIDLSNLEVRLYVDGAKFPTITQNGNSYLFAGGTHVLINPDISDSIGNSRYVNSNITFFDGNDAIQVLYDGKTCDIFGEIGAVPTGPGWNVAGVPNATKNKTLIRKFSTTQGNITPLGSFGTTPENSEWIIKNKDYSSNLGFFGAVLKKNSDINLDASYDVPISAATSYDLIITQPVGLNANLPANINFQKINNIVFKNPGMATFTIQPNANLAIAGVLIDMSGGLAWTPYSNNNTQGSTGNNIVKTPPQNPELYFNIKSTAAGTGTLIHNFQNAIGNIERYISGNPNLTARCYHGVSIPIGATLDYEPIQSGLFMGSYLYDFDESINSWVGMGTSTTTELYPEKGYLIFYPNTSTTYNFEGFLIHDEVFIPYEYTNNATSQGFNFVPNPYPSHIDFSKVVNSTMYSYPNDLTKGFWVWDNGNYKAYTAPAKTGTCGPIISIGQAFFIKCNTKGAGGSLWLTNECRVGGGAVPFYGTDNQLNTLRITANGNQLQDEILFVFDNKWNLGSDECDMLKMTGSEEAPQLSSISADNEKLTINAMPLDSYETVIPLSFTLNASTQVEFVADISNIQGFITPYLIDKKENKTVNLRQNPVYTFNHTDTDTDKRFELRFVNVSFSKPHDLVDENVIYVNSNNKIVISVPSMQDTKTLINVYDMQGKLVSSNSLFLTDTFVTEAPFVPGIYMVSVSNSKQVINKKIVIAR